MTEIASGNIEKQPADPLADIRTVGENKAVGYLPLNDIQRDYKGSVQQLIGEFAQKGYSSKLFHDGECAYPGGALYVVDQNALEKILEEKRDILASSQWPTTPAEFIQKIATETAPSKTALFDVVADAFADRTNPGRTDVENDMPTALNMHKIDVQVDELPQTLLAIIRKQLGQK